MGYSRATLVPSESFEVDLQWTVQHAVTDDNIMFVHLLDHKGQAVAGVNAYPLEHAYRTYEWKPGETIITRTLLDIPASVRLGSIVLSCECIPHLTLSVYRPWMQPS